MSPDSRAVVAVTGGSRGIGAAVSRRLAHDGYDVLVGFRSDEDAARGVVEELQAAGAQARSARVDVTDPESLDSFFDAATALGPLRGVVASAGAVAGVGDLVDIAAEDLRRDVEVSLLGPVLTCRAAVPRLDAAGGSIVLMGSAATTSGRPGTYVHYAAAKAGVATLTVGLAKELAPRDVRVNCVEPGVIVTGFHADPDRPAKLAGTIPAGRPGQPEDVAGAAAWLLSDDAAYTTGAVLRVAGGL